MHVRAQELVESPLMHAGIVPAGFVDSYALNLYHDGRLAQPSWIHRDSCLPCPSLYTSG